jgi:oligopeptide/dipeptide ABC transporter ATP-binding protein
MKKDILLEITGLQTHFYTDEGVVKAVDGIDVTIHSGETLALVGESGCGKSVTALSILQLVALPGRIAGGRISFEGQNLLDLNEKQMQGIRGNRISFIFQEPMTSLNPVYKIGAQVAEVVRLHQRRKPGEADRRAVEMLAKVGIPDPERRMKEYPHQMSGGMRQRVMIAMALACNPTLIIADEPTTALDVTIQAQILDLMNNLKKRFGTSILLITHDLGVVAEMAQSVAVMYAGQIVEYARVEALFSNPRHPYTIGLMASIPSFDEPIPPDRMLNTIPGIVPSLIGLPPGCTFRERCSSVSARCAQESIPLIDTGDGHMVRCRHHDTE